MAGESELGRFSQNDTSMSMWKSDWFGKNDHFLTLEASLFQPSFWKYTGKCTFKFYERRLEQRCLKSQNMHIFEYYANYVAQHMQFFLKITCDFFVLLPEEYHKNANFQNLGKKWFWSTFFVNQAPNDQKVHKVPLFSFSHYSAWKKRSKIMGLIGVTLLNFVDFEGFQNPNFMEWFFRLNAINCAFFE